MHKSTLGTLVYTTWLKKTVNRDDKTYDKHIHQRHDIKLKSHSLPLFENKPCYNTFAIYGSSDLVTQSNFTRYRQQRAVTGHREKQNNINKDRRSNKNKNHNLKRNCSNRMELMNLKKNNTQSNLQNTKSQMKQQSEQSFSE